MYTYIALTPVCAVVAWKFRRRLPFRWFRRMHGQARMQPALPATARPAIPERTQPVGDQLRNKPEWIAPLPLLDIQDYDVRVISNARQCNEFFQELPSPLKVIGLDCEWGTFGRSKKNKSAVALLQLAFTNKTCALLRLSKFTNVTPVLLDILTDER